MNPSKSANSIGRLALACVSVFVFANCASSSFHPGESQFLQQATLLSRVADVPFKKSWRAADLDWSAYDKVEVRAVSLEHLRHSAKIEGKPEQRSARDEAAGVLALYTKEQFVNVFTKDRKKRFEVVESPTEGAVVCEIAITEFIPASPWINAAATGLGLLGSAVKEIALNAGSAAAKSTTRGVISIEVQFTDAQTGRLLFMYADRERGRPSLVNVKDFQKLGHAKAHIRTWAKQTLAVIKKQPLEKIYGPLPIDLKPW